MTQKNHLKRATSRDVAQLAGVSRTTVSLVINNTPMAHISEETRARVHEAIARLDYHPHDAARNLRIQASRNISVAVPDLSNPHYLQLIAGMDRYAQSQGYSLLLFITGFDTEKERRCFEQLKQKRNDALILISGTGRVLLKEIRAMHDQGYHITNLSFHDTSMFDANIDSMVPAANTGERLALTHLWELGHRRIGYIYGVANLENLSDRLYTCLALQQELGLPVVEEWIYRCGPTPGEAFQATQLLIRRCQDQERPTALVVVNDYLATGVLSALWQEQLYVPTDMSVISFDNAPVATFTIPPLTTIDYDALVMGENAARLTIERLATPDRPSVYMEVPPRLVMRGSTAAVPVAG